MTVRKFTTVITTSFCIVSASTKPHPYIHHLSNTSIYTPILKPLKNARLDILVIVHVLYGKYYNNALINILQSFSSCSHVTILLNRLLFSYSV